MIAVQSHELDSLWSRSVRINEKSLDTTSLVASPSCVVIHICRIKVITSVSTHLQWDGLDLCPAKISSNFSDLQVEKS